MANLNEVRRKPINITLKDGIERELIFDLNAMAELEDAYGSVDKAFEALEVGGSVKALRKVLWAGLLHEENPMSETQIGQLVDLQYMAEIVGSLNEALTSDMPAQENIQNIPAIEGDNPNAVTA